jgi:hypothetical protein
LNVIARKSRANPYVAMPRKSITMASLPRLDVQYHIVGNRKISTAKSFRVPVGEPDPEGLVEVPGADERERRAGRRSRRASSDR